MAVAMGKQRRTAFWLCALFAMSSCGTAKQDAPQDTPHVAADARVQDVAFHSRALNRQMQYRVIFPRSQRGGEKLATVYLLHGGGGNYRDWSNYADLSIFADKSFLLVMPEGHSSYYTNSATNATERYEDYIIQDLIADVESKFPVAIGRDRRAILGVSMGGFGAIKIALRHSEIFAFAGGLSPALDVPSRPFSIRRIAQWEHHRSIFGWNGQAQHDNDPFVLAQSADDTQTPFLYLVCGEQEGLLTANQSFAALLQRQKIPHEFHTVPGGHDWAQWRKSAKDLFVNLLAHSGAPPK